MDLRRLHRIGERWDKCCYKQRHRNAWIDLYFTPRVYKWTIFVKNKQESIKCVKFMQLYQIEKKKITLLNQEQI